jgi:hypothetical protein
MFSSSECFVLLQVQASAMGLSLVQGNTTECMSLCVITCNNNLLQQQWLGRKRMDQEIKCTWYNASLGSSQQGLFP